MAHLGVYMFPVFFVWGLVAAFLREKMQNIASPIAAHVAANGLALIFGVLA